jgi:hypothetical protein
MTRCYRLAGFIFLAFGAVLLAFFTTPKAHMASFSLDKNPLDVYTIELTRAGRQMVLVRDSARSWRIKSAANAPAKTDAVRGFLLALAQIERGDRARIDADNLDDMGLGVEAVQVILRDKEQKILQHFYFGKATGDAPNTRFMRTKDSNQAFVAQQVPNFPDTLAAFADVRLPEVNPADVTMLLLTSADLQTMRFERSLVNQGFSLMDIKAAEKLNEPRLKALLQAFVALDFQDIDDAGSRSWQGAHTFFFRLSNGLDVSGQVVLNKQGLSWLRINGAAGSTASSDVKADARRINALRNYAFGIAQEKAGLLAATRADVVL